MPATPTPNFLWKIRKSAAVVLMWLLSCAEAMADGNTTSTRSAGSDGNLAPSLVTQKDTTASTFREQLVLVDVNHQQINETVLVLQDRAGKFYLAAQDLQRWRMRLPESSAAITYQGDTYFPLSAFAASSYTFDAKKLTLTIEAGPQAFVGTAVMEHFEKIPPPIKPSPGGFFNYDLVGTRGSDETQRSGQFEEGFFNGSGVGTNTMIAQNLGANPDLTRLDTTWTVDFPQEMQTLHLGDSVNVPGTWGRAVHFGGVQYGTNFATQPGFVTFPMQTATGLAVLPSTVDVMVNNALVAKQNVPPGPFSISNLPVVTGAGQVELVVHDLLGREQIITQPFYASPILLRPGLNDFSYEAGFVRDNYGLDSDDYGSWLGTGTYRRGLTDNLTGEIHAETMQDQATAGFGGDYLLTNIATLSAYAAGSRADSTGGALVLLGIDREAYPWTVSARTQWMTNNFTQVGLVTGQLEPIQISSYDLSYATAREGSIGLAYVVQENRGQSNTRLATLSYNVSLGKYSSLSFSALRNLDGDVNTTIFATLTISLSASTSASFSLQSVRDDSPNNSDDFTTTLQRNLPAGEGYGYRLTSRTDGYNEGQYSLQNNVGTYSVDVSQSRGATNTQLEAAGGVALLDGSAFFSRQLTQSFAVAEIPDYPNVRIFADNQLVGKTDANGNALIPLLRPYDRNIISIDQSDLPMDAEIDSLKLDVVPYFRSGVLAKFPIKHAHGATLTIKLENGAPLPVGASVQIIGNAQTYAVGYGGEAYITDLGHTNRLNAHWHGQSCEFDVPYKPSKDPLPDLGVFICKGVTP